MNIAIIMAAGKGLRVGGEIPKQFVEVDGHMLVEYSIATFQQHPGIDEIVVVIPDDCPDTVIRKLQTQFDKITQFVVGGTERFQSSWNAVRLFADRPNDNLLLHDAARPGITPRIIDDLLHTLETGEAAVTALPAIDTVLHGDHERVLLETFNRSRVFYAQTPQAFRAKLLFDCFTKLWQEGGITPTDESGLVKHFRPDVPIHIVIGEVVNFKVTYPNDLKIVGYNNIVQILKKHGEEATESDNDAASCKVSSSDAYIPKLSRLDRSSSVRNRETPVTEDDYKYMRMAIEVSERNIAEGGGPFGAVIVKDGEVIAASGNRVVPNNDPTAHAEVTAIREACAKLGTFQLIGATLYASCEPCPMCLSSIYWAGISRVFYAGTRYDSDDVGFDDSFIYDELSIPVSERSIPFRQSLHGESLRAYRLWATKDDKVRY